MSFLHNTHYITNIKQTARTTTMQVFLYFTYFAIQITTKKITYNFNVIRDQLQNNDLKVTANGQLGSQEMREGVRDSITFIPSARLY